MKTFKIDIAASADLVAAVPGKKIRVTGLHMVSANTVTAKFQSGASTDLTGAMSMAVGVPHTLPRSPDRIGEFGGYFETAPGEKLNVVLSAGIQVSGFGTYELVQ